MTHPTVADSNAHEQAISARAQQLLTPYRSRRKLLASAVTLQILLLAGLSLQPMVTLATGRTLTLETIVVDPWDMFRGDYIILGYSFSNPPDDREFTPDQCVYAVLRQDSSGKWQEVRTTTAVPELTDGEVMIAGKARSQPGRNVSIRYGIEQVYVPEGRGRDVRSGKDIEVDVSVDGNGHAVIREVRHKGSPLYRFKLI